jgi:hypothetical protein
MSISTRRRHAEHPTLTAEKIWAAVAGATFAVISHVTPEGAPRSSGVMYTVVGDRMYVIVARDSWKARHIRDEGLLSVTVPVRRGGLLSLLAPIPPATISFPAVATVHAVDLIERSPRLARMVPAERRADCALLEIRPTGHYVIYGLGVPLLAMRDAERSRARVPVG